MRAVGLSLVICAVTCGAYAAPKSPLDIAPTLLGEKAEHLPKGLKKAKDCFEPQSPGCTMKAPGVSYYLDEGVNIGIIEMFKVGGRFLQPLPLGLTEKSRNADVRKAYRPLGIKFEDDAPDGRVISSSNIPIPELDIAWLRFQFDKDGRLERATLRTPLTSD